MNAPTKAPERIRDLSYALCGVCGGPHDGGLGYAPDDKSKIMWTCSECIPIAAHVYGVPAMEKSKHAQEARDYAMSRAAEYLEKLGKLDLTLLSLEDAREFFDVYRREWSLELRRLMASYAPPF